MRTGAFLAATALVVSCTGGRPLVVGPATPIVRATSTQDAPVSVELAEVRVTLREDGTWKNVSTTRYTVLDRSALDNGWGATGASYSPWYTKKPTISASVRNVDSEGRIQNQSLDPATLTEEPEYPQAPDVYGDTRVLRAPLPNVQVGSTVEEVITTESHRVFLHPAYLHRAYFEKGVPVRQARFVVDAPESMDLSFKVFDANVKRTEVKRNGRQVISYEGGPYASLAPLEDSLPPDVVRWPNVAVARSTDWTTLSNTYEAIVEEAIDGIDFDVAVSKIIASGDTPRVKMTKILQWVKDRIRYVGVEFGDSAIVPYAPDKTIARGFGDCKDQATLMVGLLRAAGLPAELVLLNAGRDEDISPEVPALNVFNHAIVRVRSPDELYIDPTGDLFTVGNLPLSDQGRYALVIGGPDAGLRRTPEPQSSENTIEEIRTVQFKASGEPDVREVSTGTGYYDWELRSAFRHPSDQLAENLKHYVKDSYSSDSVTGITHSDPLDLSAIFTGTLVAEKAGVGSTSLLEAWSDLSERAAFRGLPSSLLEGTEERKAPLYLGLPYTARVVWKIAPPKGFVLSAPPGDASIDLGAGKFTRRVESSASGSVTLSTELAVEKPRLSAKEVNHFREKYATWASGSMARVVFRHRAWDLAQKGKIAEAVEYLREAAKSPDEELFADLRMSRILRPVLEDVALRLAEDATRRMPTSVEVWREAAEIAATNAVGEDMGVGFPRAQAIRAYRRVYELDPKQLYAKLRHAVALEHDERGERYESSRADLLEAAALYDSIPPKELREFDGGTFRNNVLYALFWAADYDEVGKRLNALPRDEAPRDLLVMMAGARGGAAAAVALIDSMNVEAEERSTILQAASGMMVRHGNYTGAAEALDAIRAEGADARTLERRAKMLRGIIRVSEADLPEDTPGKFAAKVVSLGAVREAGDKGFVERYLAPGARLGGDKSPMVIELESARQNLPAHVSRQLLLDMIHQSLKVIVDGNPEVGYRVKATSDFAPNSTQTWYLIEDKKRFAIRAGSGFLTELGAGAWEALQSGQQSRAKQWLNWAREVLLVPGEEDPLRVPPFGRMWNDGQGDVQAAAAVLAASSGRAKDVLPYLEGRLKSATSPEHERVFQEAVLHAYAETDDHPKHLAAARALSELVPNSQIARRYLFAGLWNARDFAAMQTLAERSLKQATTETEKRDLKDRLASALAQQGKFAEAKALRSELMTSAPGWAANHNNAAWLGMFAGPSQQDVDHALKALELERSPGSLHTLGCLYAELGWLDKAGKTLVELRGLREGRVLEPQDWYIVGRVAEHLGFLDEAKRAYNEVNKPEHVLRTSTYSLAQRRLQNL